jgi:hypothetical protein
MNEDLQIEVQGDRGWLFQGELPGTVCFVPEKFLTGGVFDWNGYAGSLWSGANLGALPEDQGIGSQGFPEIELGPLVPSPEHDAFLAELRELVGFRKNH